MAKQTKPPTKGAVPRPVHTLRHRAIEAAIWKNQTTKGAMYKVTIRLSYKKEEQWHETQSFGYDDLMNVAKLLYDAHSWISAERAKEAAGKKTGTPPV